jgi:molecular chaperone DnaK (HSP70)
LRYIIGIDLGTTNTCVSYVDTQNPLMSIQLLRIPQLVNAAHMEELKTLPSCCYLASKHEWPGGALDLPWKSHQDYFVGSFAMEQGSRVPTKLVQSAKSWLCHAAAQRREKILPFEAVGELQRISPVEASSRYLKHIREAWNHLMAKGAIECEFEQQDVVLTVPASFDEIARTLTIEAAKLAGYGNMTLLEEPQAAFYSWISQREKSWKSELKPDDVILVCDVGGGTTDFSLIEVAEANGELGFQRMSVGDHLLLGGDNMDAALAHHLEAKLDQEITPFQWLQIKHQAREAKEILLGNKPPASHRVAIQSSGSHIIQNTLTEELNKEEVEKLLMEGFWKQYPWDEAIKLKKGSGIRSLGLPYEEEPSITKHLAHFLKQSLHPSKGMMKPDYVLFNGGSLKPKLFQDAIISSLKEWFPEKSPLVLESYHMDLAVSRGAAYYGKVRRGFGVRIGGGSSRGYYFAVGNASGEKALTLLPRGTEEGTQHELEHTFQLLPNTPVAFRLYSSHVRLYDKLGELVEIDTQEMQLLPPIHTILRFGKGAAHDLNKETIPVHIGIALTEIGTLELWLKSQKSDHRWRLEFQLRKESGQEASLATLDGPRKDETYEASFLEGAKGVIKTLYSGEMKDKSPKTMELLEQQMGKPRREWSLSILRGLWDELSAQTSKRKQSLEMEARWWNLAGFFLRPGFGFPLDDFRIKDLWKVILSDGKTERTDECSIQTWICYRRIAGGLNKGQQMQIGVDLFAKLPVKIKNKSELYSYEEKVRALASMELLDISMKIKLAQVLLTRMKAGLAIQAEFWALGRIGARHLAYGSIAHVIPREICAQWIEELLQIPHLNKEPLVFLFGQLARKTELRELNLAGTTLDKIIKVYNSSSSGERLKTLLFEERRLTAEEQDQVFGDQLPLGLSLEV